MRLTSRGQYAVAAMVDLATREKDGPVALATISDRQNISLSYLEQMFRRLREDGLVRSMRGPGGGYLLTRETDKITIADIIRAVDEEVRLSRCINASRGCRPNNLCQTHALWLATNEQMLRFLSGITLADVLEDRIRPANA